MIKVMIQAEAGSRDKARYDEKTMTSMGTGRVSRPYPYPYGFVVDTTAADGDNVDCYVVGHDDPKSGTIVECEPVALLEQIETGETDHKVLAVIAGLDAIIPADALEVLRELIHGVFADYPDSTVSVGPLRSREAAIGYIRNGQDGWAADTT